MNNYWNIYKKAAAKGGWMFEKSKNTPQECRWKDLYTYVIETFPLKGTVVLDIGTGEGRKFIELSSYILLGLGIDTEPKMISLAERYRESKNLHNLRFLTMNSKKIQFPDEFFDIITCRHAPFSLKEVYRLLKPKGIFITQQIHEKDKKNLKDLFGRGQNFKQSPGKHLKQIILEAREIGLKKITHKFSNLDYYFNSRQHLIDFLRISPVIPNFDLRKEKSLIDKFVRKNQTKKGIKSNSARFLVIMKK